MDETVAASLANMAAMLGAYYLNLLEHGLPPYMAIELVRDYQRVLLERVSNAASEPKSRLEKQNDCRH